MPFRRSSQLSYTPTISPRVAVMNRGNASGMEMAQTPISLVLNWQHCQWQTTRVLRIFLLSWEVWEGNLRALGRERVGKGEAESQAEIGE